MSHVRRPLVAAAALNGTIVIGEAVTGYSSHSLSLVMDSFHNFSDQLGLICLCLAFIVPVGLSRGPQRLANLFNSLGLVGLSVVVVWQAFERLMNPGTVVALVPMVVGLLAALANGCVALTLRRVSFMNPAIRLAYLHNLGDVLVSLAPVAAGILVSVSGLPVFDPIVALLTAGWIICVHPTHSVGEPA
jgi:cobalt-zinc-cadmium efflux system protein